MKRLWQTVALLSRLAFGLAFCFRALRVEEPSATTLDAPAAPSLG